ncbi:MAG: hypothetical protein ACYC7E_22415 [Armatimonadota bacterium]
MQMPKSIHEVRDPIHTFIRFSSAEREVLNSRPFQRLRHIHQLAMSYLVYPGATHRRFEHSLGVMELADRVFNIITAPDAIRPEVREMIPELGTHVDPHRMSYWRQVLRIAALCHDLGHLVEEAAIRKFGAENVRYKNIGPKDVVLDFPVEASGEDIVSARALSRTISDTPQATADYVFIEPSTALSAKRWRDEHLQSLIALEKEDDHAATA